MGQHVRVKLAPNGYRTAGRMIVVPVPNNPSLNLLVCVCREAAPKDTNVGGTVSGIVRTVTRDDRDRGPGVVGEVGLHDCTFTADQ